MRVKTVGWTVGALGLLLGAGRAVADQEMNETTKTITPSGTSESSTTVTPLGSESVSAESKPECKDAGVMVSFATASADLDTNARGALNGVATWMKMKDDRTIRLQGYTDKKGGIAGNQRLSERRAAAVKDYLLGQGIEPERIKTIGLGEESDHLPASGRTVTVIACDVPTKVTEAVEEPPPAPEPLPAVEPPLPVPLPPPAPTPAPILAPIAVIPPPPPPAPLSPAASRADHPASGLGVEGTVGGGVIGFTDTDTRVFAKTGGEWEARMTFGSRLPIAFEAAYIGSIQGIEALGLSTNAMLLGNGGEGTLRVNFTRSRVQPYVFGGGGFTHYQVTNTNANLSALRAGDNVGTVPTGLGLSLRLSKEFLLDFRGTYRFTFNDSLLNTASADIGGGVPNLDTWNVAAKAGFEF